MWPNADSVACGRATTARGAPHGCGAPRVYVVLSAARQPLPPARKAIQASFIRSTWPFVNMFMQESWV